jgi:hypothetical protein
MKNKKLEKGLKLGSKIIKLAAIDKEVSPKEIQDTRIIAKRLQNANIVNDFRKRWGIDPSGFSGYWGDKNHEKWADTIDSRKGEIYLQEIVEIMNKLKIPKRFFVLVEGYLLYGDTDESFLMPSMIEEPVEAFIKRNPATKEDELLLRLEAGVKRKDLTSKNLWEKIKHLQTMLPDYGALTQRRKRYLDTYEQIYKWKLEGYTYKQIQEKTKEKFGYNIRFTEDVGTILKRYKKQVGITGTRKMKK